MSAHSPGSWRNGDGYASIVRANGDPVVHDCGCGGFVSEDERRLAVAAPELLAMLKKARTFVPFHDETSIAIDSLVRRIEGGT
ncbi:MAG: hypothetical protein LC640_08920 [Frankia sp.]|nr:hypothetical protein [Frankia sp.]